jgi:hypothetical protein
MLVHAFPKQLLGRPHSGIWKDIQSRLLLWEELEQEVFVLQFDNASSEEVLTLLPANATRMLLEYSWWPDLMEKLRGARPQLELHVRTINAESLQNLHRFGLSSGPLWERLRTAYGASRLLLRDRRVAKLADSLVGISDYDDEHYWRRLNRSGSTTTFPYYCPWPWLEPYKTTPPPTSSFLDRKPEVLCLAGTNDRIGQDMVSQLGTLSRVAAEQGVLSDWDFSVTAGLIGERESGLTAGLTLLDPDIDVWDTLHSVRAVAVLGRFGYGLKTTIVDAVAAGCHVILSPEMWRRLPPDLRPWCVAWDCNKPASVRRLAEHLDDLPAPGGPERNRLRKVAALDLARAMAS